LDVGFRVDAQESKANGAASPVKIDAEKHELPNIGKAEG